MVTIKIKYHAKDIDKVKAIPNGDWLDLRAAEDVELKMFQSAKISLGISMKLPEGYEAHLAPRSSTFDKWGIIQTNSTGIIDNSYSGENDIWAMPVLAMRDTVIHKNDRICQFRIMEKMPEAIDVVEVDHMEGTDRGGFGSTGTK